MTVKEGPLRRHKSRLKVPVKTLLGISVLVVLILLYSVGNRQTKVPADWFSLDVKTIRMETKFAQGQNANSATSSPWREEQRHLVYIRIPKTGSSTMTFLIWRFGLSRNLTFLLPKKGGEGNEKKLSSTKFFLPAPNRYFDVMANHVVFNYADFTKYFPADTVYISLIREPLSHLTSTLHILQTQLYIPTSGTDNIVSRFLRTPELFEPKQMDHSFTRNPVMTYFGLKRSQFANISRINEIIAETDRRVRIILVLERFNESLVLLKNTMRWTMRDILYIRLNVNKNRPRATLNFNPKLMELLCQWSKADCLFYEHFYKKLDLMINNRGKSFTDEVKLFENYLSRTQTFCEQADGSNRYITFNESQFNPKFRVTLSDCRLMTMKGLMFLDKIRAYQHLY